MNITTQTVSKTYFTYQPGNIFSIYLHLSIYIPTYLFISLVSIFDVQIKVQRKNKQNI